MWGLHYIGGVTTVFEHHGNFLSEWDTLEHPRLNFLNHCERGFWDRPAHHPLSTCTVVCDSSPGSVRNWDTSCAIPKEMYLCYGEVINKHTPCSLQVINTHYPQLLMCFITAELVNSVLGLTMLFYCNLWWPLKEQLQTICSYCSYVAEGAACVSNSAHPDIHTPTVLDSFKTTAKIELTSF